MAPARPVAPGFSPLDEELGLLPGALTPRLVEHLVRLGTWMPFVPAGQLLQAFTGVSCSPSTARRQTEAAGAVLVAQQTAAASALAPPCDPGPDTAARLQVSADGAMVALREGGWAEVKTVAVGRVTLRRDATGAWQPHTEDLSYFARLAAAEEFTRLAVVELHGRGVRAAAAVAGVQDGAPWLQGFLDYHCSDALRILDFPHALEHVAAAGRACWGAESSALAEWLGCQAHQLKTHGPLEVVAELRRLQAAYPHAAEGIAEQLAYLEPRLAQMDYPGFAAAGWPLGSGLVESANKLVVEARLKGAGMRWAREQVNPLLGLRTVVCSDRWGVVWPQIAAGLRVTARRAMRRSLPAPAIPAPDKRSPDSSRCCRWDRLKVDSSAPTVRPRRTTCSWSTARTTTTRAAADRRARKRACRSTRWPNIRCRRTSTAPSTADPPASS